MGMLSRWTTTLPDWRIVPGWHCLQLGECSHGRRFPLGPRFTLVKTEAHGLAQETAYRKRSKDSAWLQACPICIEGRSSTSRRGSRESVSQTAITQPMPGSGVRPAILNGIATLASSPCTGLSELLLTAPSISAKCSLDARTVDADRGMVPCMRRDVTVGHVAARLASQPRL